MRLSAGRTSLLVGAVTLLSAAAATPPADPPPGSPLRELSKADATRVTQLHKQASDFGRVGKFVEAQGPIREIVDLCRRELGENHYRTGDYKREIELLKKLAASPEAARTEYLETYKLGDKISELSKARRYADALQPAERLLELYRRILGVDASYVAIAAFHHGQFLHNCGRYRDADPSLRDALRVARVSMGEDHPNTATAHNNLALNLEKLGKHAEARQLQETALAIEIRLWGEGHPKTGVAVSNLAAQLEREGDYRGAERLQRKAVEALTKADADPSELATTYSNLGLNLENQGRYDEAEEVLQSALKTRLKVSGPDDPQTGFVYINLAAVRDARGDYGDAEPFHRRTLDVWRTAFGDNHLQTAWAHNNLGVNLDNQGLFTEGEEHLRKALAIVQRPPAEHVRAAAVFTNNLSSCLRAQGKLPDAVALVEKALTDLSQVLPAHHPDVAVARNNAAACLADQGRHTDAERHFRDVLAALQGRLPDDHPNIAFGLNNLGRNLHIQGRYGEAERPFRQALDAQRRRLGEGHPHTAWTYRNLVGNALARNDLAAGEALADAATASFEQARRRLGSTGLGRARRSHEISPLPGLAVLAARRGKPEVAWQALERELARGLLDDLSARPLTDEERNLERDLLGMVELTDRRVEALPADAGDEAAGELRRQRDAARTEWSRFEAELAKRGGVKAGQVYDLPAVRAQLRDDEALLTWVDFAGGDKKRADPKGEHWACLVRKRGDPVWVQVPGTGPNNAWTVDDDRRADLARAAFADRAARPWKHLARDLAAQRLTPIAGALQAAPDRPAVRHLIVLPSLHMSGVPVEALLTEDITVSYAPSGTMFAWLQEQAARRAPPAKHLLAFGDPAFQRPRSGAPATADRRAAYAPLPGTRRELHSISRAFDQSDLRTGPAASEQRLNELAAAGGLLRFPYLHFATHGVLDAQRPMRSSLILARDPAAADGETELSDARVTADRILRWNLDAELVTLSACDTGRGKHSGGEGYLGFSQALFLAGARSMVLSLWQVDDTATALLMARFYENLLGTPDKTVTPMTKARALAEAKQWLKSLDPTEVRQLTQDLETRGTRGKVEPRPNAAPAAPVRNFEHPYYWSGFILVGAPR